ncbi:hypothetical protein FEM48_Zijuj06G0206000 [Ziziphus jujuba var. spinosa]|uniref:Protein ECERIFERUM 1-like n=1 Tax=Ziziphus jujuba var. spinosa TaxID=714518 RepID=A0A978VBH3_ZIZJJ|nr:hypothetical protein FEM48_Zijuj06G0206000 [Ziziphus jujuba var. spinosa]
MASKPGILSDWPWKPLGCFKYMILAPWAIQNTYLYMFKADEKERDLSHFLILPLLLWRFLHNQIWITLSRYRTTKVSKTVKRASNVPLWRADGAVIIILLHVGPVELLNYWLHRALHHHFLYSRHHSHHHSSIVTKPITSVIHPFAEHLAYFVLFASPMLATLFTGTASIASHVGYVTYIDFMNNMRHCNFELVPNWIFSIFPPLNYNFLPYLEEEEAEQPGMELIREEPITPPASPTAGLQEGGNSSERAPRFRSLQEIYESEELNRYGGFYVEKHPKLKIKLGDGSSLAVAVVLNNLPEGTTQVLLIGKLTKIATVNEDEYLKLNKSLNTNSSCANKFVLSKWSSQKIWLVGDEFSEEKQLKASKGTIFIRFSQFPPKKLRKDCFYHYTPAMVTPTSLENLHSCENWLPRRVMSAWRVAGIVHALEGWKEHECGDIDTISNNVDKIW